MARRNRAIKRLVEPDIKYNNQLVASFINKLMANGKKTVAASIFYDALDIAAERVKKPGLEVFEQAIKNVTPMIEVRPRRVGGATYQVPLEVRPDRRQSLAIRWLVTTARARSGKTKKEQAYFIWKHRHLIVTRPENLNGHQRRWLSQMFS
jgi:small subunit ribosomal protein S7